jgi:uncharacterized protein (TIGR00725 family)
LDQSHNHRRYKGREMRKTIIGIMGGCAADESALQLAYNIGKLVAENGWTLLNGGRSTGIMDASAKGAKEAGGTTIGVLFEDDRNQGSEYLDFVLPTGMGAGRNIINVLSSDVVIACPGSGGTMSEIAMALRVDRPVVLLGFDPGEDFLDRCGNGKWKLASTAEEAVLFAKEFLTELGR